MGLAADEHTGRRFGKYEVLCQLALGGMAEIFLGFPHAGPFAFKPVVLKRIAADHRDDPSSLQMLIDEARLTARLANRHVAQVLDLEIDGDEVVLVIELIRGANVDELVAAASARRELLPLGFVITLVRDAASGLQHAHAHQPAPIMHRDVTPRNLMMGFDGVGRVLDFGIARTLGAARRTLAGMVRGTAAYMSPEQAIDAKLDTRSDLFSLGTVFHELLTGQRLFARGNPGKEMAAVYEAEIPLPSAVNKRVPKALDAVVMRLLERPVQRRTPSATALLDELQRAPAAAWPAEKCGGLVLQLFETRHRELNQLLQRVPEDASAASTDVGRQALPPREQDTVVGVSVPVATTTDPAALVVPVPQLTPPVVTATAPSPAPQATGSFVLVLGALAAMLVGAVGGVAGYRWLFPPQQATVGAPLGRLSLASEPAAVVQVGGARLRTPLVDAALPAGHHVLKLRAASGEGPWRRLEVDVSPGGVTQAAVRLDTLPALP